MLSLHIEYCGGSSSPACCHSRVLKDGQRETLSPRLYAPPLNSATRFQLLDLEPLQCRALGFRIVAESRKPMDPWLLAKPCQLTLGVVASGLLNRSARCI